MQFSIKSKWLLLLSLCSSLCASTPLATICNAYHRPFTVLEIGSPEHAMSIETAPLYQSGVFVIFGSASQKKMEKRLSHHHNVIWFNSDPSYEELSKFAHSEHVDILLLRNEVFPQYKEYVDIAQKFAHTILLETTANELFDIEGMTPLEGGESKYYILQNTADFRIERPTMIHPTREDRQYLIECNFDSKQLHKILASGTCFSSNWHPGINLITFLMFAGSYPSRGDLVEALPIRSKHNDWAPNNMIVGGKRIYLIDDESKGCRASAYYQQCREFIIKSKNKSQNEVRELFCKLYNRPDWAK